MVIIDNFSTVTSESSGKGNQRKFYKDGYWVKSISYTNGTFKLTDDKSQAKGYTNQDAIRSDIDKLTYYSAQRGMGLVFFYD